VGRSISISYVVSLFSQDFRVSFIFNHGLNPVGVFPELVCRAIVPLAFILSSSESFPFMSNFFPHPNSLACHYYRSVLKPHHNFLSCFTIATNLIFSFITTLTSFCVEHFHSAWGPCSEFLESFLLVVQSVFHFHFNRSL
jgi:hypothetical protein